MEYIERTEIAGNTISNNNNHPEDNIMETNTNLTVTIPMNSVMEALAKDDAVINVIYGKMKDDVESLVNSNLTDSVESAIEDKMTEYVTEDDIWDKIQYDVEQAIADSTPSGVTEDWIESNLDSYVGQRPENLCSLGRSVWNAICHTIGTDISLHLDKVKAGNVDFNKLTGLDTAVIDLVKLITVVSENVTKKVIEEEKQKYLANREEYLVDGKAVYGMSPEFSVEDIREFIDMLKLSPEAKGYIHNEFVNKTLQIRSK